MFGREVVMQADSVECWGKYRATDPLGEAKTGLGASDSSDSNDMTD